MLCHPDNVSSHTEAPAQNRWLANRDYPTADDLTVRASREQLS